MRNNLEMEKLIKEIDCILTEELKCGSIASKIEKLKDECYAVYKHFIREVENCGPGYELEKRRIYWRC